MSEDHGALAADLFEAGAEPGDIEVPALAIDAAVEPWASYPWLHFFYAVVAVVVLATGLLIQFPDLRAHLLGGYGTTVAWWHEWTGAAMLLVPVLGITLAPSVAWETVQLRSWRADKLWLHAINLWFTLLSGVVFVVTGFLLWFQARLPDSIIDWSYILHDVFSYALYVMLPLHVLVCLARTVRNMRARLSRLSSAVAGG